ncbi:MAG: phosphoribosylamine--glycine ligase, partial [Calditrichaeota bacterium]|nr:phosphoribosylamine--glycine ligase [Calditrichota bacterium]
GRVLGITATGNSLAEAIETAYRGVEKVHFEGMHFRTDIAKRAL